MIYTGEVLDKKAPSGNGYVVFNNQAKKPTEADTIKGVFSMKGETLVVSNAKGIFANGAKFQGEATINIENVSEKPVIEKATCTLNGHLEWPGKPMTTGLFKVCRKTDCDANTFELTLDPYDTKDIYTMVFHHGAYKGELQNGSTPKGQGTLNVLAADRYESGKVIDIIEGVFDGNSVSGATLKFNSGYKFVGDLNYEVSEKGNDEVYSYNLNGKLIDGKGQTVFQDTAFVLKRHTDLGASRTNIDDFEGETYISSIDKEYASFTNCDNMKVLRKLKLWEKTSGKWDCNFLFAEKEPVFYYSNGTVVTKFLEGINVDREDASFVVKNDHLTEFTKTYEEGFFHYVKEGQSQIIYKDGSRYEGTLAISSGNNFKSVEDEIATYLKAPRMSDYRIMYLEGKSTYANGKQDVWKKGITDYQANKIAGNYEGRKKLLAQMIQEEAKAADKAWEEARTTFEKDYGKHYVDAFYGYRLIEGMPLSMFKRAKEMGLPFYDLLGPFSTNHGPFNQYVLTVWNRQTGEMQYQKSIYFDRFKRLYKTSNSL